MRTIATVTQEWHTARIRMLLVGLLCLSLGALAHAQEATEAPDSESSRPPIGLWEQCETPQALPEMIPAGAPLGLTGPISIYGIPQQQGVDLAVREINAAGYLGDSELTVIYEDTEGDAQQAISAMTKLLDQDDVAFVFGPSLSTEAFAADPIAQEQGVPVMGVTTSAVGIPDIGDYVFRGNLPEEVLIPFMLDTVQEPLNLREVAVLYGDDDDFTLSGYDVFVDALRQRDITILDEATFARGDVDFNPQLTVLLSQGPDALVVSALAREGVQIILQARELGYEGLILGGNGFNAPDVIQQAGEAAEGLVVGASWNINQTDATESSQHFVDLFEAEYGFSPDQFSVQAYTVMWLYATAIRCQNSADSADIRDGLLAIERFDSPLGDFSFGPTGEPMHEPVVQVVFDGMFTLFTPEIAAQIAD
jgi:branched-chain amino acid transport system substrate-binding protein